MMIRLLIVNMEQETGGSLQRGLQGEPDIQVVGAAQSVGEALSQLQYSTVDVVLFQSALPHQKLLWFIRRLRRLYAEIKVLIMDVDDEPEFVVPYLEAGAVGYTLCNDSLAELAKRIRAASRGESLISPTIAHMLAARLAELDRNVSPRSSGSSHLVLPVDQELSPRQKEVLAYLEAGHTNQEIANLLYLEIGTVKNHVHAVLTKLGVSNRHEAAALASLILGANPAVHSPRR